MSVIEGSKCCIYAALRWQKSRHLMPLSGQLVLPPAIMPDSRRSVGGGDV
jgi:hypothetical protein